MKIVEYSKLTKAEKKKLLLRLYERHDNLEYQIMTLMRYFSDSELENILGR